MRISKDATSYRARGVLKRDARHTKGPPEAPRHGGSKKKDTRRWCGGHVGREHKPKCFDYRTEPEGQRIFKNWKVLACTECGRQLDHYYGKWSKRPAWVTC